MKTVKNENDVQCGRVSCTKGLVENLYLHIEVLSYHSISQNYIFSHVSRSFDIPDCT